MTNDYNYFLGIINAAVSQGFEFDPEDSFMEIYEQACNELMEYESCGSEFVQADLDSYGNTQAYTFIDPDTGHNETVSGEIFDFTTKSDAVYYRREEDGSFTPLKWFEVPAQGEDRSNYIFVYAKEILSNGKIAYMYDYLK